MRVVPKAPSRIGGGPSLALAGHPTVADQLDLKWGDLSRRDALPARRRFNEAQALVVIAKQAGCIPGLAVWLDGGGDHLATALILVSAAAALLISAVVEVMSEMMAGDTGGALLHLLDRALLVLMLAEIIYTVRSIARRRRLEVEPFFIVAIIAAIRRILITTAESTGNVNLQDPHFQAAMLELGLLSLMVLALAGAMRIIPGDPAEEP